jgi:pimeloyl-ACP methyl ester carboxylesterase
VTFASRLRLALRAACLLPFVLPAADAMAAPCERENFDTQVSGVSHCLQMRRFGAAEPAVMVVWLHGDVSGGGPANYHFQAAQRAAEIHAGARLLSVALVRPGYADGSGDSSGVDLLHSGRQDHYTRPNLAEVGGAIERLRKHYKPQRVVVVGHSGGAATTAVLLGLQPGLIDAALLAACPCDLGAWRAGRRPWPRSENPVTWADKVPAATRVIALTGGADDNTLPDLAETYVAALRARGVDALFELVPQETHNGVFRSPALGEALARLLAGS